MRSLAPLFLYAGWFLSVFSLTMLPFYLFYTKMAGKARAPLFWSTLGHIAAILVAVVIYRMGATRLEILRNPVPVGVLIPINLIFGFIQAAILCEMHNPRQQSWKGACIIPGTGQIVFNPRDR